MSTTYPRWFYRVLFLLMLAAIVIRIVYWAYTDRTWEDALITVLHSENAARGLGLTHLQPPGEPPLHGFTSPLSVLIPLAGDIFHVGWGLQLLKLVSIVCGAIAVWLGARISQVLGLPPALALTVGAFLAFEHHQILWGMAGMETQVVTAAYLWSILVFMRGTQWQKGFSLGLAMLARPDAAFLVLIALIWEGWAIKKTGTWRSFLPIIYGLVLVYGPWLLFTFLYYGSPVPNTVRAKSAGYPSLWFQFDHMAVNKVSWIVARVYNAVATLGPAYGGNGTGFASIWDHRLISLVMLTLATVGAIAAIVRRHRDAVLLFAVAGVYILYLVGATPIMFAWYTAPVVAVTVIGSFYGLWVLASMIADVRARQRMVAIAGVAYILAIVSILPITFPSDKYLQMYVDGGIRKEIGLYINQNSLPTDTVGSEPLGYVGYYSRRVIYDYPGLCSREVVKFFRDHPNERDPLDMMRALRPTYLVLRTQEYADPQGNIRPWIAKDYEMVLDLNVPEQDRRKILHHESNMDFHYRVYRMKTASSSTPPKSEGTETSGG